MCPYQLMYVRRKDDGCSLLGQRKIYKALKIKNSSFIQNLSQNLVSTQQTNINNYAT